jgi:hypothetical protein
MRLLLLHQRCQQQEQKQQVLLQPGRAVLALVWFPG